MTICSGVSVVHNTPLPHTNFLPEVASPKPAASPTASVSVSSAADHSQTPAMKLFRRIALDVCTSVTESTNYRFSYPSERVDMSDVQHVPLKYVCAFNVGSTFVTVRLLYG